MENGSNLWNEWQELLQAENPDLLRILTLGAQFQAYFATIENETLQAARAAGVTWDQLGNALGTSRQAVWQRATTWDPSRGNARPRAGSRVSDERLAHLRRAQEVWAEKRDTAAAAMFDGLPPLRDT
jgi:hypothetical protein